MVLLSTNVVVPSLAFNCSGNLSESCVTSHPIPIPGCGFGLGSSLWTPLCFEFAGVANALCWPTCSHWWDHLGKILGETAHFSHTVKLAHICHWPFYEFDLIQVFLFSIVFILY